MPERSPQVRGALRLVPGGKVAGSAPISDEALVSGIARGDRSLAGELCQRLLPVVDSTLFRVLGGREPHHDDLLQAAFEQIVGSLYAGKFLGRSSLTTWASAVTCNVALQAIRRRRTERRFLEFSPSAGDDTFPRASSDDPERDVAARRELELVRRQLGSMSRKLAETLLLHDVLGCDLNETAATLRVSVAAAQSRLVRGRKELLRRLARHGIRQGGAG
jgi:RNA polymerase sigma-70 factor (ECF subfamily)